MENTPNVEPGIPYNLDTDTEQVLLTFINNGDKNTVPREDHEGLLVVDKKISSKRKESDSILDYQVNQTRLKKHRSDRNISIEQKHCEIICNNSDIDIIERDIKELHAYVDGLQWNDLHSFGYKYPEEEGKKFVLSQLHKSDVEINLKKSSWTKEYDRKLSPLLESQRNYLEYIIDEKEKIAKFALNYKNNLFFKDSSGF